MKKIIKRFWNFINLPTDSGELFAISARCVGYGFLLFSLLYTQAVNFDGSELITIISFVSIATMLELILSNRKTTFNKLIWQFVVWMSLIVFLFMLVNQATKVRNSWYRTNVIETRIQSLIETAPTAIIASNGLGTIKYVNQKVTELVGWQKEELIGKPLTMLMRKEKAIPHMEALEKQAKLLKYESAQWIYTGNTVFTLLHKTNKLVKVQIYLVGIRYPNDLDAGTYSFGEDVEFYAIIEDINGEK